MTQQELLGIVAEKIQSSVEKATDVMEVILNILSDEIVENGAVYIDGFGVIKTQKRSEYVSLNSKTGERLLMPPSIEIVFEPFLNVSIEAESEDADTAKTDTTNTTTYTSTDKTNANNDNNVKRDYSSKILFFEPDVSLRNSVNSAFINFEPTVLNEGVELSGLEVISDAPISSEDTNSLDPSLASNAPLTLDTPLATNAPISSILTENQNATDVSEAESAIAEQVDLQEKVMMHHTVNVAPPAIDTAPTSLDTAPTVPDTAPPIKQCSSNSRIWVPLIGGVAIILAALFFFNGTTEKKGK